MKLAATVLLAAMLSRWPGPAASVAQPCAAPAATQPSAAPADANRPAGKWSCWSPQYMNPRCITPKALWFGWHGNLWRVDRKTDKVETFSVLDGLPLEHGLLRVAAAADERCAILTGEPGSSRALPGGKGDPPHIFLWDPQRPWRAIAAPENCEEVFDIGFAADDRLLALVKIGRDVRYERFLLTELVNNRWREVRQVDEAQLLIPLPEGVMLGRMGGEASTFTFLPADANGEPKKFDVPHGHPYSPHADSFRAGGKTFARIFGNFQGLFLSQVGPDGLRDIPAGRYWCWDAKAGGAVPYSIVRSDDERAVLRPAAPAALPEIDAPWHELESFWPMLDPDGRMWLNGRRWDGRQWESFELPSRFPGYPWRARQYDRLSLDTARRRWVTADPRIPLWATCYDPNGHSAWVRAPYKMDSQSGRLVQVRQRGDKLEVLRSPGLEDWTGTPRLQSLGGDWWWCGHTGTESRTYRVLRLTTDGLRTYAVPAFRLSRGPRGEVWAAVAEAGSNGETTYRRYDAASDSFVQAEPWEDFAFTFGTHRLSYMPVDDDDVNSTTKLYCQVDGRWEPFITPYSPFAAEVSNHAVHAGRLLVSVANSGVLEYDAATDRWTLLAEWPARGTYDAAGRRIITCNCVLVYEGEPIGKDQARRERQEFDRLLKRMDDESWKVRDEATREMTKDIGLFAVWARDAAEDPKLSIEVRNRLKAILSDNLTPLPLPPPLLRIMHPVLRTAQ